MVLVQEQVSADLVELLRRPLAYCIQASVGQGLAYHFAFHFGTPLSRNRSSVEAVALFED